MTSKSKSAASAMANANIEIIMRDPDFQDAGEITRYSQWKHTLKINDVGSWQLDLPRVDYEAYKKDNGLCDKFGIMFLRDKRMLVSGPIKPQGITHTTTSGEQKTSIQGYCDNAWLMSRFCYPVVTGPVWDTVTGAWKFDMLRSAVGLSCTITKGVTTNEEYEIALVVDDAESFGEGNTVTWVQSSGKNITDWYQMQGFDWTGAAVWYGHCPLRIKGVDLSTNTITIENPQGPAGQCHNGRNGGNDNGQILAPSFPSGMLYQTSGGIVSDPTYKGYDVRDGPADVVAKELVYFNAGAGACSDHFGSRAWPFLRVAPPNGQGLPVTANSRFESLLAQVQDVCLSGGIFFRITQADVGVPELVFDTFSGNDLSIDGNLIMSEESGNLGDHSFSFGPPVANFVMGAGPNTGPEKCMLPNGSLDSINSYGRWEVMVASQQSQSSTDEKTDFVAINTDLVQTTNAELAKDLVNVSLSLSLQETDQLTYPDDFDMGDMIGAMIGDELVAQIVTSVDYSYPSTSSSGAGGSAVTAAMSRRATLNMEQQQAQQRLIHKIIMA